MNPLAWVNTHQKEAQLGGAGALGVIALALYRRHQANAAAGAGGVTGAGTAAAAANTGAIAGLSGTPNTYGTDQGNYFQDQLNGLQNQLQAQQTAASNLPDTSTPAFYQFADSTNPKAIYEVFNGAAKWLTWDQFKQLGQPKFTITTTLDPIWSLVAPVQVNAAGTAPLRTGAVASTAPPRTTPVPSTGITLGAPTAAPRRGYTPATSAGAAAGIAQSLASTEGDVSRSYVVPRGGSLAQASHDIYGDVSPASIQKLAENNPHVRLTNRAGQTVAQVYPGQVLKH